MILGLDNKINKEIIMDTIFGLSFENYNTLADAYLEGKLAKEEFAKLPIEIKRQLDAEQKAMGICLVDGNPLDAYERKLNRKRSFNLISEEEWRNKISEHSRS